MMLSINSKHIMMIATRNHHYMMENHLGSKNVIATMSTAGVAGWRETLVLKIITYLL